MIARSAEIGSSLSRTLAVASLIIVAAFAPALPPIAWKVKATMLSAVLLIAAFYVKTRTGTMGRTALDIPALFFLLAAVLATIFSVDPLVSAYPSPLRGEGLIPLIAYIAVGLAAARLTRGDRDAVITAALIGGTVIAFAALLQYFGVDLLAGLGFTAGWTVRISGMPFPVWSDLTSGRSVGTLGHPMFLGAYMALLIPIGIVRMWHGGSTMRWVYGAVVLALWGALLASGTRAAWIAIGVALVILTPLMARHGRNWRPAAGLLLAVAVLTAAMAIARPQAGLYARASSIADVRDGSFRQRLYIWEQTFPLIAERPLLGWGFSTMLGRFPDLGSPRYREVFGGQAVTLIDNPHNEVLNVTFSTGVIGLLAYLWVWAVALIELVKIIRRPASSGAGRRRDLLAPALLASLAAYGVWMQAGWSTVGVAGMLWLFLGFAASGRVES